PQTFERFEFLRWFRGILVSGEVGVIKPDPRIFELLLERFAIDPKRTVYIDDVAANAELLARSASTRSISRRPPPCAPRSPNSGCFPRKTRHRRDESDRGIARKL
ncbi:MAG: HAD-IA family hydrolase, partial [Stellaceae bacterium]